jgi:hypothetical protein
MLELLGLDERQKLALVKRFDRETNWFACECASRINSSS